MIEPQDGARRLRELWDRFTASLIRPPACDDCGSRRVTWDGWSIRTASAMFDGQICHVRDIRLRRASCVACGYHWIVRPPGISPNRHYQLCVVASALSEYLFDKGAAQAKVAQEHDCSERTVGRWLRWAAAVAEPAALGREILETTGEPILPVLPKVASIVRKARTVVRRQMVTRAAQILSLLEALGTALGLEPPGLRGVIEHVLCDRATFATYARPLIPEFAR